MEYAEEQAYGITKKSIEFVEEHRRYLESIVQMECFLAGMTYREYGDQQWVRFIDINGDAITVSGLSWGYGGEGPHGLCKVAQSLGFDISMKDIASYPQNEYWTVYRERMGLTCELASYLISLQGIADGERGLSPEEFAIRDKLELEFPQLKADREHYEFSEWLWSKRTEAEEDVREARYLLGQHIPFDEIYSADGRFLSPDDARSTYSLYKEHSEVAGELFQDIKTAARQRLAGMDKRGEINLHKEWREELRKEEKCLR